jgi:hypothetical protein
MGAEQQLPPGPTGEDLSNGGSNQEQSQIQCYRCNQGNGRSSAGDKSFNRNDLRSASKYDGAHDPNLQFTHTGLRCQQTERSAIDGNSDSQW